MFKYCNSLLCVSKWWTHYSERVPRNNCVQRLSGLHSRHGLQYEDKNSCPYWESSPDRPALRLVVTGTEISQIRRPQFRFRNQELQASSVVLKTQLLSQNRVQYIRT